MKRADKRQSIIRAAIRLFSLTHDVNKVSLETIAREAGVSPTTIYNLFRNRENLVCEVSRHLVQDLLAGSRRVIYSDLPFPQKVSALFSFKVDLASANSALLSKILRQSKAILDENELSVIRPLYLEFVEAGKKQGFIDPSLSSQTLLDYFDILREGIAAKPDIAYRLKDALFINELTRLILYGLLNKDVDLPLPGTTV